MEGIFNEIKVIDTLWNTIDKIQKFFEGYLRLEWSQIKPGDM
jgi:hypothetical protein